MNAKILINLREGTIEAEGEVDFVKNVYEDFKDSLVPALRDSAPATRLPYDTKTETGESKPKKKNSSSTTKKQNEGSKKPKSHDNPHLDKHLDTRV